jgi:SanA protein
MRRLIWILLAALLLLAFFPFAWQSWVQGRYAPAIYTLETVPAQPVAIVYGARVMANGHPSAMLRDRVETAVRLYEAGKVEKIIFSGDNRFRDYDEPGAMMAYALQRGVPPEAMQPDYAGLRTYDTCYRARDIFGVQTAVLVTQQFHLPRALFICDQLGLEVVGVAADLQPYSPFSVARVERRERWATMAALLDVIRQAPPPILGEPIPLRFNREAEE